MAELVSVEEGIEKVRAPHVDGLYVGVRGSWAYRKQGAQRILIDGSLFLRMALLSSPLGKRSNQELQAKKNP